MYMYTFTCMHVFFEHNITCVFTPPSLHRIEWMYLYQGMVILASNQVWWTWEVEDVFRKVKKGDKMGMKNYAKKLHGQIDALVVQVRANLSLSVSLPLRLFVCLCLILGLFIVLWIVIIYCCYYLLFC